MKTLKTLGILLLVLITIALITSAILPKTTEVTQTVTIDAPLSIVWANAATFEKQDAWSPWRRADSLMKVTYEGKPGTMTSKMAWTGEKVGAGSMLFTSINAEEHTLAMDVNFTKPMEGTGHTNITAVEADGKTTVTWDYLQENGFIGNLMPFLFNAKGMLSEAYEYGLGQLKTIAEAEAKELASKPSYVVREIQRNEMNYVVKRQMVKWAEMNPYFQTNLPMLKGAIVKAGLDTTGVPSSVTWNWDEENMQADMSVAIPVKGDLAPEGYTNHKQMGGTYLTTDYYGSNEGLGDAHDAIHEYLNANGYDFGGPVVEEHVTGPGKESDPAKWLTKIFYPVVKKATE